MELIGFIQVFNIIVIAIGTLFYMCCRSLTFSSSTSSSSSSGAAAAVDDDNNDDVDIPSFREKHDVFISFRGEDTRLTFTSHLHAALLGKKIETYIDYRLKKGDEIGPALLEAIEKSRLSMIIFSKNYASSTWCLIELVHILKCKKKNGQMVVPIFYDISPSDVRKQKGSYADAFAELENRFKDSMGKVRKWRKALRTAANLSGFDYSNKMGTDAHFIKEIVDDISTKLKRETSYDLKGMVGIQSRIEEVKSLLSNNDSLDVCTVGIWGMGGIGKTTLAKAVFKRLSSNFDASCLLNNVGEKSEQKDGVDQLQKTLLKEILREENLSIDSTSVRERLSRTKVLIVFDDVSDSRQIKDLAGDNLCYGDGSRIIVTSRERSVLLKAVRERKYIYQVEKLKLDDALRLFQFHAFNDNSPKEEYTELSARVVKYAGGIPLALEVLGSLLFPCESKDEWEDVLSALRNYPNEEIQNTFRVSYNRLERNAQEVFLDIACFRKGDHIEDVKKMVDFGQLHGGSCAADGIRVLRDRSLISIDSERETIDMHDLVQEMGWEIVREQCIEEPGRRSRLFIAKDVYNVLKNNTGTKKVQAIFFNRSNIREQNLNHADFKKMYNLRLLNVDNSSLCLENLTLSLPDSLRYLSWEGYPLKSLPQEFSLENLVELHMPNSQVTLLWNGGQNPMYLKVIKLRYSKCLTELPNLLRSPNIEHIDLFACKSLVEIPLYFQDLDKLTYLNLAWCTSLKYLPKMPGNIEFLSLSGSGIKELPSSVWSHEKISSLDITYCEELKELPSSSCKLKVSGAFSLKYCYSLGEFWELPRGIGELDLSRTAIEVLPTSSMERLFCLTTLKLKDCKKLTSLPSSICKLKSLEVLDLTGCSELEDVPNSIYKLTNLKTLSFYDCSELQNFPQPAGSVGLLSLEVLNLGLSGIFEIPANLICSTSLRDINLRGTKIRSIPSNIKQASQLSWLCLIECRRLTSLPQLPVLSRLEADGCKSLKTVSSSMTVITQCWNRHEFLREQLYFSDCHSLDYNARSSIMVDAQLRIMRVATAASKLKEEEEDYEKFKEEEEVYEKISEPLVTIVYPGNEIPNWFIHKNEGASINVRLPANWFREGFLGFALSVVASNINVKQRVRFGCKYNFETEEGGSHEINCFFNSPWEDGEYSCRLESKHVFVLYKDLEYEEGAKWSSDFYYRVTKVSVLFYRDTHYMMEKCGICLLYAEDDKKLKFDIMLRQEQDEPAASGSGDPEASGRDEFDYSTNLIFKGMVGITSRIEEVESLLSNNDSRDVFTVGIWGMGGIGKTTLAKSVFKRLSSNFEACCLLNNVREKAKQTGGVDQLKKTLLREILNEKKLSIDSISVQKRLRCTKVLIVFDDVSASRQIKDLAGDNLRYGDGSRIIVTSRKWSVLMKAVRYNKHIYEVEELKTDDALRLFQFHAFNDNSPREEYRELSQRVVGYARGIPLALEILGSLFLPCKNEQEWEDVMNKMKQFPRKNIHNVFRISYDRLEENEQEIFLDIACFYKGNHIEDVKKMVDFGQMHDGKRDDIGQMHGGKREDNGQTHGGSSAADGIRVLGDKSLISIDSERDTIDMHDLVQEMGWEIVREQCIIEPGRHNRLFIDKDVYHVLKYNTGTERVQAILFNKSNIGDLELNRADFRNMYNLRLLNVDNSSLCLENLTLSLPDSLRYLSWEGYPLKSLPQEFSLENLVELHMPNSRVTQLWNGGQNPMNLKVIKLRYSKCLTELPNLLRSPNIKHIDLFACESLVEIPSYFQDLDKLTYLNIAWCKSLKYLPEMPGNIEFLSLRGSGIKELPLSVWSNEKISSLDIRYCAELKKLPNSSCKMKVSGAFSLRYCSSLGEFWELPRGIGELNLSSTAIKVLPTSSMESLFYITKLKLCYCRNLACLPPSICKLKSLEVLDLIGCTGFYEFPEILEPMEHLKFICLQGTAIVELPQSIGNLTGLQTLYLDWCMQLKVVPSSIYKLTNLKTLSFFACLELQNFPQPAGSVELFSLEVLNLGYSGILEIPGDLICLTSLRDISLTGTEIRSVPSSIKQASQLSYLQLTECKSLESLPELPVLSILKAAGCESLKTVSSSRTAITQCWNRYELLREQLDFSNCRRLCYVARSNIMADAQLRIMRVATASSKLKEEDDNRKIPYASVTIQCPGFEIPNWFLHKNEGASINVRLPANWFHKGFLGFALSVVASQQDVQGVVEFECKYNFKTKEGESHEIKRPFDGLADSQGYGCSNIDSNHVLVLYEDLEYEKGEKWSPAFYDRVTEVFVHFEPGHSLVVEKCGICLLYAEDAEKLKFDYMSREEQDVSAASGSGNPKASGSDEKYHNSTIPYKVCS